MEMNIENAIVMGLASAGTILMVRNMQKEGLTNAGILLGGIVGPATVYGLGQLFKE